MHRIFSKIKILPYYLFRKHHKWSKNESGIIRKKIYKNYSDYVEHQKSKLREIKDNWLPEYDVKYRAALRERLRKHDIVKANNIVLCLAARIGTEVKAFLDIGCFAIGLDLSPGEKNKYVVYGDFHNIQFPTNSVDVVFTNSLDHALNFNKLIKEIKRVLKPSGTLLLETVKGLDEGGSSDYWNANVWKKTDELLSLFIKSGFKVMKKDKINYPWDGQHIYLRPKKK